MMSLSCFGHKIVVLSKLPINKDTLVYGSHNAAYTIQNKNAQMEKMMRTAAERLNLKAHKVRESRSGELKTLHMPVDIEGHLGMDGRFYVVGMIFEDMNFFSIALFFIRYCAFISSYNASVR